MRKTVGGTFAGLCYNLLKEVPPGRVTTYGEIARALNCKAFRAVGQAMNKNPYAPEVPCHRVVCSDGSLGGFAYGIEKKITLLAAEGVEVKDGRVTDFASRLHSFSSHK